MTGAIEGGCLCRAVRYRVDEDSPPCMVCFCTDCQRRSGSSHQLTMPVWRNCFEIEGETVQGRRTLASGVPSTSYSCSKCLTELYSHSEQLPDLVMIRAGTRDDAKDIVPAAYIWVQSKQPWIAIPPNAQQFDTQPNDPVIWATILEFGRRAT